LERQLSGLSLNYNFKWSVKLLYEYAKPLTCYVVCASDRLLATNSLLSLILNHEKYPLMMKRSLKEDANVMFFSCLLWYRANKDMNRESQKDLVVVTKLLLSGDCSPGWRPHPPEKTCKNPLLLVFELSCRTLH